VVPRHLLAAGRLQHGAAHARQHLPHLDVRRDDVIEQALSERAVGAGAVEGDVAGLGGVDQQGADAALGDGEAAGDGGRARRAHGARQILGEGVVAAGVEEHQLGARPPLHQRQHQREVDGLEGQVVILGQPGIDRTR
jgi:hypothetical protein